MRVDDITIRSSVERVENKVDQVVVVAVVRSGIERVIYIYFSLDSLVLLNNIDGTVAGVGQYCHHHRHLRNRETQFSICRSDGTVPRLHYCE
jgi:hypothetical protein